MPSPPEFTRRRAVGIASGVVFGSVVLDAVQWSELEEWYARLFPSARLGRLVISNRDSSTHVFSTTVTISGTTQYERTQTVAPDSSISIEESLPQMQGRVSVLAELTDLTGDGTSGSLTLYHDTCHGVGINYSDQHGLWFSSGAPVDTCDL